MTPESLVKVVNKKMKDSRAMGLRKLRRKLRTRGIKGLDGAYYCILRLQNCLGRMHRVNPPSKGDFHGLII